MLRTYITTALRYPGKNKTFSLLNILGLALGLACCMLIALVTVSSRALGAALANPIKALRSE